MKFGLHDRVGDFTPLRCGPDIVRPSVRARVRGTGAEGVVRAWDKGTGVEVRACIGGDSRARGRVRAWEEGPRVTIRTRLG